MSNLFDRINAQKVFSVKKSLSGKTKKYQESCQEIQKVSRNAKNFAKKSMKTQDEAGKSKSFKKNNG